MADWKTDIARMSAVADRFLDRGLFEHQQSPGSRSILANQACGLGIQAAGNESDNAVGDWKPVSGTLRIKTLTERCWQL